MKEIREELKKLEEKGQLRKIPAIESKCNGLITIDNKDYINFASNDYLSLSTNIELRNEFLKDSNSLMSSASARLLTGNSVEYNNLERELATLFKKDACLIFNTGWFFPHSRHRLRS